MAFNQTKSDASAALLFIRLALGIVIFAHGAQKVLGWFGGAGFSGTIEIFRTNLSYPMWMVLLLMFIEFLGSLGLIIGFMTRMSAAGIAIIMVVCAYQNHLQNGFFMNWYGQNAGEGFEYHILAIAIGLALIISGGGNWSIDRTIASHWKKRS